MKHSIYMAIMFGVALLAACSKDNTPVDTIPERNIPAGNIPNPQWNVAPGYDYSSSMTAVVEVDLTATYPDLTPAKWQVDTSDLLAAFAGETCLGVTSPSDDHFFLYITAPSQDGEEITLRYYSTRLRNVFLADDSFHFENGARHGSVVDPLTPAFREFNPQD